MIRDVASFAAYAFLFLLLFSSFLVNYQKYSKILDHNIELLSEDRVFVRLVCEDPKTKVAAGKAEECDAAVHRLAESPRVAAFSRVLSEYVDVRARLGEVTSAWVDIFGLGIMVLFVTLLLVGRTMALGWIKRAQSVGLPTMGSKKMV